ncbi:MAG: c-type cytochrome [Sulfuricaulis sp.]
MFKIIALFPALIVVSLPAHAVDLPGNVAAGKKLYDANCISCHTDSVYTRQDRKITSLDGLKQQVHSCGHAANIKLRQAQIDDLVKYLNTTYYKFK